MDTGVLRSRKVSVHMGPSDFCQTVSLALAGRLRPGRGVPGRGVGGVGEGGDWEERAELPDPDGGKRPFSAVYGRPMHRCGHSDSLWLELRIASSPAPTRVLVMLIV